MRLPHFLGYLPRRLGPFFFYGEGKTRERGAMASSPGQCPAFLRELQTAVSAAPPSRPGQIDVKTGAFAGAALHFDAAAHCFHLVFGDV